MGKQKLKDDIAKEIVNRIKNRLVEQGITSLPDEDFSEEKAEKSFEALMNSDCINNLILKEVD